MAPLTNIRILITRTAHQASTLATQLQALGAETVLIPTVELAPPTNPLLLQRTLADIATYDWLVFTSANAVEAFASRQPAHLPPIAAIGAATAAALEGLGLTAALIPPQYVAESLAETLLPHLRPASRILLIRAEEARDTLPEALTAAGAHVTVVPAYRTITPPAAAASLRSLFADPARWPHAITFTSSSTASNLFALLAAANIALPETITLASIGPITSQTLRALNHPPTLEAPQPTMPALVQALTDFYA